MKRQELTAIKAKILASKDRVFWMAGLGLGLLLINAFLVMTLYRGVEANSVHAMLVPYVDATDDISIPRPLVPDATSPESLNFLTRALIKEYVNARYRVTGSGLDAVECIFFNAQTTADCPVLTVPSKNTDGTWTHAFLSLLQDGEERNEIAQLYAAGSTRAVKFLSEPELYRDRWRVKVEFVIRDRGVWDIKDARREIFEIQLDIGGITNFRLAEIAMNYAPSTYFDWRVNRVWRFRR